MKEKIAHCNMQYASISNSNGLQNLLYYWNEFPTFLYVIKFEVDLQNLHITLLTFSAMISTYSKREYMNIHLSTIKKYNLNFRTKRYYQLLVRGDHISRHYPSTYLCSCMIGFNIR